MDGNKFVNFKRIFHLLFCILISPITITAQFPSRHYQYSSQLNHLPTCSYPGYSADPWNCTRFFRCVDYGTEETALFLRHDFSCAPGTVFDPSLSVCNHPGQVSVGQTTWCQYQVQTELDKLKTPDYYSWDYYEYERQLELQRQRQRQLAAIRQSPSRYRQPYRPRSRQQKRLRFDEEDDYNQDDYGTSSSSSSTTYLNSDDVPQDDMTQTQTQTQQVEVPKRRRPVKIVQDTTEEPQADTTAYVYHRRPFFQYQVQIPYIRNN